MMAAASTVPRWFIGALSARAVRAHLAAPQVSIFLVLAGLLFLVAACGSSGGDRVVFVSENDGDADIYLAELGSGELVPLTSSANREYGPALSPDGKFVAYVSEEDGQSDIHSLDLAAEETSRLTRAPGDDHTPRWDPDGETLAFVSTRDGNSEVYVMELVGGRQTRITSDDAQDRLGDWSPGGVWLAFVRPGPDGEGGIWVRNPGGVNAIQLTDGNDADPVWSPDSRRIAFVRNEEGNADIYVVERLKDASWQDETRLYRLTHHADHDLSPAWSSEDDIIAFVTYRDGNAEIYTMQDDGSDQLRLTTNSRRRLGPGLVARRQKHRLRLLHLRPRRDLRHGRRGRRPAPADQQRRRRPLSRLVTIFTPGSAGDPEANLCGLVTLPSQKSGKITHGLFEGGSYHGESLVSDRCRNHPVAGPGQCPDLRFHRRRLYRAGETQGAGPDLQDQPYSRHGPWQRSVRPQFPSCRPVAVDQGLRFGIWTGPRQNGRR